MRRFSPRRSVRFRPSRHRQVLRGLVRVGEAAAFPCGFPLFRKGLGPSASKQPVHASLRGVVFARNCALEHFGGGEMESREDCLREATECDRLADLANTRATRALLAFAAFQWRKLAEKAEERHKTQWPLVPEAIRPN